jgi:FtsP/CotA-like multicopper oxidase with cupredoxin domain
MRLSTADKRVYGLGAWIFGLFAVLLAFGALWVAGSAMNKSEDAQAVAAVGGAGAKVSLSEFKIEPAMVDAKVGGTLAVSNDGTVVHNVAVKGTNLKTKDLQPGESATLDLKGLKAGDYTIICKIPGHESAGMTAMLMLGSGGSGGSTAGQESALKASDDASNATMKKPVDAYVAQLKAGANTKGVGNQPLAPKVLPDGTKEFDITSSIIDWEVSPGHTVRAWAYNGQVPGPMIKVNDGDKVRIAYKNDLPQSSAIHFHGIEVPNAMDGVPDVTQKPVKPGETFNYEFVARGPAVGMYHSHHHAEHQVPDGLTGALVIGDEPIPAGYGPVSQEIPMVLNDAGVIGLSLNGKSFPATAPVMAHPGETVEIHYYNEGLQIHPMHLHGIEQLVIAKDGFPLPQPYRADTVSVAPGERYTVLVKPRADQLGVWAYHCHILTHAEGDQGMFGMVTTFIVQ